MGTTYYAKAVIGCNVTGKLPDAREERVCNHDVPLNHKNCSDCGKPRVRKVRLDLDDLEQVKKLRDAGMEVVEAGDNESRYAGVAVASSGNGEAKRHKDIDFGNVKEDVRAVLEPLGLWDDKTFGLWAVQDWN